MATRPYLGLALPQYSSSFSRPGIDYSFTRALAKRAEDLGFDSIWLSDHLMITRSGSPSPVGLLESWTTLSALAAQTCRVRLGTLVICTPFRHPGLLAKMASTLDVVSGGRLILGLGAGWHKPEFDAFGIPFGDPFQRVRRFEETIRVLQALLTHGQCSFRGEYYTLEGAVNSPEPVQRPRPPLWVAAFGPKMMRLAASLADGWNYAWAIAPEQLEERVARLHEMAKEVGREPTEITISVGLMALIGADRRDLEARFRHMQSIDPRLQGITLDDYARGRLVGTPDQLERQIASYARAGAQHLILNFGPSPFSLPNPTAVEIFGWEVIRQLPEPGRPLD